MVVSLRELQRIPTSGARAVEPFHVDGIELVAIPQLAFDVPGQAAGMNVGDSDTELLLLRRVGGRFEPYAVLPAPGGEDAEFFTIGDRAFLAVASIRSGSGPYALATPSRIFEWTGGRFVPFQTIETYAAKQWRHWRIGDRHFLALAQGLRLPAADAPDRDSMIYEWDGAAFAEFQPIPSQAAYNWHAFAVDGTPFLAHADHLGPSTLFRWDGERYRPHQVLLDRAGRCFATVDDGSVLLVGGLLDPPQLMRWTGEVFHDVQELDGLGARELLPVRCGDRQLVVRVNFILGTPADPTTQLMSQVYEWDGGRLHVVAEFPTSGGTDAAVVARDGDEVQILVSNALSSEVRFATDTVLYALRVGR